MKLIEITVRPDRITIRREGYGDALTPQQRCTILLTVIGCYTFLKFISIMANAM